MSGPTKPDYGEKIGEYTQHNYNFLKELWGANGMALRDTLINDRDEGRLRALLAEWHIYVADNVRIMIVDVERAKTNSFVNNGETEDFYLLVLPPAPRRHPQEAGYKKMQGWASAYYHAITDSYGM
jgi:hypothetical protein